MVKICHSALNVNDLPDKSELVEKIMKLQSKMIKHCDTQRTLFQRRYDQLMDHYNRLGEVAARLALRNK